MSKSKKKKQAPNPETSVLDWYEKAGRQGYLDQKKKEKDPGNRLDQAELDKLKNFKKNLETQQTETKKAVAAKAKEAENNTHWFDLAEKQGYLDH